ncbi:MAG: hypothetical protein AAFX94_05705, partial [Myxococcota bacterium]
MSGRLHLLRALSLALLLPGCISQLAADDDDEVASSYRCSINPELIESPKACRRTDQCPCGSRCEFGQCVSDCSSCGVDACSPFGFCDGVEYDATVVEAGTENFFQLGADQLTFRPGQQDVPLTVVRGNATDTLDVEVRVRHPAYALRCDPDDQSRFSSCRLRIEDSPAVTIRVVSLEALGVDFDDELDELQDALGPVVTVASQHIVRQVPIAVDETPRMRNETQVEPGVYRGLATLNRFSGTTAAGTVATPIAIPIRVSVAQVENGYRVAIDDAVEFFGPQSVDGSVLESGLLVPIPTNSSGDSFDLTNTGVRSMIRGEVAGAEYGIGSLIADLLSFSAGPERLRFQMRQFIRLSDVDDPNLELFWNVDVERDFNVQEPPAFVTREELGESAEWVSGRSEFPLALEAEALDAFDSTINSAVGAARVSQLICGNVDEGTTYILDDELSVKVVPGVSADVETPFFDGDVWCRPLGDDEPESRRRFQVFPLFTENETNPELYAELLLSCLEETLLTSGPDQSTRPARSDRRRL